VKLLSYLDQGMHRVGVLLQDRVVDIDDLADDAILDPVMQQAYERSGAAVPSQRMIRLLAGGPDTLEQVRRRANGGHGVALSGLRLLPPVPRPGKIVAIGRNYADHAKETGIDPFEQPRVISKLPSSALAHGAVVVRPAAVAKLDFEAELGVVIGRHVRHATRANALDAVAGYTVLNDISAREFQFDVSPPQTTFAKSMDGFCPMGPWLVTADEVADPQRLELRCWVNDQLVQSASTSDMIFPVARLIEYVTTFMTLEPGDVIATGTPAGVGAFRKPPQWLQPDDQVRIEISGIGILANRIGADRAVAT
jgi:2-keto-4-pentenoate hydratase/2-oxohepta-3-ene-1,7-dioic acid hydratase in catechol pathway